MRKYLLLVIVSVVLVGLTACDEMEATNNNDDNTDGEEIAVEIETEPIIKKGKVQIKGTTNLPDHAELMFTITGDDYTGQTKDVVKRGKFKTEKFSSGGEQLPAGEYELKISLSLPSTQDEKFVEVAGKGYENLTGELMKENDGSKTMEYTATFEVEDEKVEDEKEEKEEIYSLGFNAKEFKKKFNNFSKEIQSPFVINKIEVTDGEVQDVASIILTDHIAINLAINKADNSVREIIMIGQGDGTEESGYDLLLVIGTIISITNESLDEDGRGDVLRTLGLTEGLSDEKVQHVEGDIRYTLSADEQVGIIFIADNKDDN